ncbi:MAG: altronate dehydratase family protein [Planctomycetes bacterium]|nr:altronate dehydratase family protein [Planctomycetota bacterium]
MSTSASGQPEIIQLSEQDNIAVAARPLIEGHKVFLGDEQIETQEAIGLGHKIAVQDIPLGGAISKYGQVIGFAAEQIHTGNLVHTHNVELGDFQRDYAFSQAVPEAPVINETRTFQGYRRHDGKAGTRNYIAVISMVNCSASTSKYISQQFDESLLKDYPNVDGVFAITHKGGCAMQYDGPDHEQLDRVLAGFAKHPNVGAYLIVGLGCETGQALHLVENQGLVQIGSGSAVPGRKPRVLTIQTCGGISKTVEAGVRLLSEMLPEVNDVRREAIPVSELVLGAECGGSDGNSGVTANPAVGVASDLLVEHGATSVIGETPEIYGAEHLLTRRAETPEIGKKLIERIKWWEWYAGLFGAEINNNPSFGNKEGGLTTIYEKSLGAIVKGGSTALKDVLHYAQPITTKGFVVMDTPGYDPASITGMVAGGANMLVFTTGRGSCFGCKPVPCIKVSTNTTMYEHMIDDMDLNAGTILEGASVADVGHQLFEQIIEVASGQKTKSELTGVGEEEFAPWGIGPTL